MTYQQAIRLAQAALDAEVKRLAVQANLYDMMGLDTPSTKDASDQRKRLREARSVLGQERMKI